MITFDATGRGHSEVIAADDPVLDGIEARFAMSEAGLSQIMRFAGTAPAQTGHDIMGLLASLMAHREENPHVDTPPPVQTDPNADARTASMIAASVGAMASAAASIGSHAGSSGGAVPSPDTGTGGETPVETASTPETPTETSTETSTETPTETSSESPPPLETAAEEAPPPVDETAPVVAPEARPRRRPRDGDHDGVPDGRDRCLDTPAGADVNEHGCAPVPPPDPEPEPETEAYTSLPPPMPCDSTLETCGPSVVDMGTAVLDAVPWETEAALANAGLLESGV